MFLSAPPTSNTTEPTPGPSGIQGKNAVQNTTEPTPGPSGIQGKNEAQLPLDNSTWFEEETQVF